MIENVRKSTRRGESIDDAYLQTLFADMISLYRLDQASGGGLTGKASLGALPKASVVLLCTLGGIWVLMGVYIAVTAVRKKKKK